MQFLLYCDFNYIFIQQVILAKSYERAFASFETSCHLYQGPAWGGVQRVHYPRAQEDL